MFVTIEGIEGSGKSTLLAGLRARLEDAGLSVVATREPGGTPVGDAVREVVLHRNELRVPPLAEALLMNASRASLVADVIAPALARGDVVLCDRYADSSIAYQGYGRGLDLATVRALCDIATGGLVPSLTVLLDVSVEISRKRTGERAGLDRLEREPEDFHRRAREGFLQLASGDPRWRVLDGELPAERLIDEAAAACLKLVRR